MKDLNYLKRNFLELTKQYSILAHKSYRPAFDKLKKKWSAPSQKKRLIQEIKKTVKKDKVLCALSGGVDSSVAALLINKAIRKK